MPRTRVTLVQLSGDGRQPADDLPFVREALHRHRDSDLVIFPEFALRRVDDANAAAALLAGGAPPVIFGEIRHEDGRWRNLATYADAAGARSYAKTHVHWTEAFAPGSEYPVVETPLGPTGMLICFDAAFAEVPGVLAQNGAKAIVNISAIPDHFSLKVVHRRLVGCSVFNQVFTFFVNRTGNGYLGGSAVVDPRGEVLAVAGERDPFLTVDVDMDEVDAWRSVEPLAPHRRPELYAPVARPPVRVPVVAAAPALAGEAGATY